MEKSDRTSSRPAPAGAKQQWQRLNPTHAGFRSSDLDTWCVSTSMDNIMIGPMTGGGSCWVSTDGRIERAGNAIPTTWLPEFPFQTGKWCFEVQMLRGESQCLFSQFGIGRAYTRCTVRDGVGDRSDSWSVDYSRGVAWHIVSFSCQQRRRLTCETVSICVDIDAGTLTSAVDGDWAADRCIGFGKQQGIAKASLHKSFALYPMASIADGTYRYNIGSPHSPFVHRPPSGYRPLWEARGGTATSDRLVRLERLLAFRRAREAHRDASMVFRAASEGRPLELVKRLRLGKLAGGLDMKGEVVVGGGDGSSGERRVVVGSLEAARLGGHDECVSAIEETRGSA